MEYCIYAMLISAGRKGSIRHRKKYYRKKQNLQKSFSVPNRWESVGIFKLYCSRLEEWSLKVLVRLQKDA